MAKNQFQMHILWFFLTPMSKCRKRPWNLYKYKKSLLRTYFSLTIEYGMYLKCLQKPRCLGWFKTSQALRSAVKKTRLNSSKDNFIAKSFRLPTKRKLSILLNFLFPFVFYRRIFNLEMQNFSLENHRMMNARQPFCWRMTFTKVSNPFLPSPPSLTVPLDVCGGVGYGWFYWFSLYWERIFSPTYNGVRFFLALYVISGIFLPGIYLHAFFLSKLVCGTFFLKSLISP